MVAPDHGGEQRLLYSEDPEMRIRTIGLFIGAALVVGCAGTPGPGDAGYPYNVDGDYSGSLMVAGLTMTGTIGVSTQPGGMVTGTVSVNRPIQINGTLNGTLAGDQLTVGIAYGHRVQWRHHGRCLNDLGTRSKYIGGRKDRRLR